MRSINRRARLGYLETGIPRLRAPDSRNPAGDVDSNIPSRPAVGVTPAVPATPRSQAQLVVLLARGMNSGPPPPRRAPPVLANARSLVDETSRIVRNEAVETLQANLIATTYGVRSHKERYENVADNLLLDINLCFEEELQKALEHDKHFITSARKIVEIIHTELGIESVGPLQEGQPLPTAAKAERENYIRQKLGDCYPRAALDLFFATQNCWQDEPFEAMLALRRTDIAPEVIHKAEALFKLLKMLQTQIPYFGGSVEYDRHIDSSLEFWIYHLSTLTKDPDRQYDPADPNMGRLIKPLKDYRTNATGAVPFMNQHNLGTGVVEAHWDQLPPALRTAINAKLKIFAQHVAQHGDHQDPGSASTLWHAYKRVGGVPVALRDVVPEEAWRELVRGVPGDGPGQVTSRALWKACSEDERKAIYADVCRLPWSDAHLIDGSESYEQTYVTETSDSPRVLARHPPRAEPGLMNVAGVFGNILETPGVAAEKYMAKGGRALEKLHAARRLTGGPENDTLRAEFKQKHTAWHEAALTHHKPIIGGMSGHTLGYMNLYADALSRLSVEERAKAPKMETLRGIMLAGLVGTKLHHSTDEVFSASTSVDSPTPPNYRHRFSYADLFHSTDQKIALSAVDALFETRRRYLALKENSVVSLINGGSKAERAHLTAVVSRYIAVLAGSDENEIKNVKLDVLAAVRDCMPPAIT